jgi:hypothetical protein
MVYFQAKNLAMEDVGIFYRYYGHFTYFVDIWSILRPSPVLVFCTEKNLATLREIADFSNI